MIRTVSMAEGEAGLRPLSAALEEEGFSGVTANELVEAFSRHFMSAIDAWQEQGFAAVAREYLSRLPAEKGVRRDIDENGDLLVRRMGKTEVERRKLLPVLARAVLVDPRRGRSARVKLLRTIRLDPSDTFVFERAAEPGEWAVTRRLRLCRCRSGKLAGQGAQRFPRRISRRDVAGLVDARADRGRQR